MVDDPVQRLRHRKDVLEEAAELAAVPGDALLARIDELEHVLDVLDTPEGESLYEQHKEDLEELVDEEAEQKSSPEDEREEEQESLAEDEPEPEEQEVREHDETGEEEPTGQESPAEEDENQPEDGDGSVDDDDPAEEESLTKTERRARRIDEAMAGEGWLDIHEIVDEADLGRPVDFHNTRGTVDWLAEKIETKPKGDGTAKLYRIPAESVDGPGEEPSDPGDTAGSEDQGESEHPADEEIRDLLSDDEEADPDGEWPEPDAEGTIDQMHDHMHVKWYRCRDHDALFDNFTDAVSHRDEEGCTEWVGYYQDPRKAMTS